MTHQYVWHDSFIVTWLIHLVWYSYKRQTYICARYSAAFVSVTWLIHLVWHDSFVQGDLTHPFSVTWLINTCDMTRSFRVTWLIHRVWHDVWFCQPTRTATYCNTPHACLRTRHREWARERQSVCTRTREGTGHPSDIYDKQQRHTWQDTRATEMTRQKRHAIQDTRDTYMGWLWLVGSFKL